MKGFVRALMATAALVSTSFGQGAHAACPKSPRQIQSYEAFLQRQEAKNDPDRAATIDKVLIEISEGEAAAVRADIKAGLNPNAAVETSTTGPNLSHVTEPISLLTVAVGMCQEEIAEDLVRSGASADGAEGEDKGSPLNSAAAFGEDKLVGFLIKHGAVVDQPDIMGHTALEEAVRQHQPGAVLILLKAHANPNRPIGQGATVLDIVHGSSKPADRAITNELIRYGAKESSR